MWSRAAVQATGEDLLSGSAQQAKWCKRKQQNMFVAKSKKKYHQLALPTLHCKQCTAMAIWLYGIRGWAGMIVWGNADGLVNNPEGSPPLKYFGKSWEFVPSDNTLIIISID